MNDIRVDTKDEDDGRRKLLKKTCTVRVAWSASRSVGFYVERDSTLWIRRPNNISLISFFLQMQADAVGRKPSPNDVKMNHSKHLEGNRIEDASGPKT